MAKISIHKPRCSSCPYYGIHSEPVPKKVKGDVSPGGMPLLLLWKENQSVQTL